MNRIERERYTYNLFNLYITIVNSNITIINTIQAKLSQRKIFIRLKILSLFILTKLKNPSRLCDTKLN